MRLIDADALKFRDVKVQTNEIDIFGFGGYIVEERKGILQEEIWNAPTIDAVPHWIPCKEKLPEYLNYVLLSSSEYGLKIGARTRKSNFDSWYINEPLDCDVWHVIGSNCMYDFEDFTAWMPLPKPYMEEKKDNEGY